MKMLTSSPPQLRPHLLLAVVLLVARLACTHSMDNGLGATPVRPRYDAEVMRAGSEGYRF